MRCAVCDDEAFMREELSVRLSSALERRGLAASVQGFSDGAALLAAEPERSFDLIVLDIQMPPPDGLETARRLRARGFGGAILFVTVWKEPVFDAFEFQACGYLLKPLEEERFQRALDQAVRQLDRAAERLLVRRGGDCQIIPYRQILYCEVFGRKLCIHCLGGGVTDCYGHLEDLEKRLAGRFFRCHRSFLVNLEHVLGCKNGRVLLPEGADIPVSRLRERSLVQALLGYMKEGGG